MEFRVLGPLEVLDDDGVVVSLGGPRPRALLAFLLLHANEVVSTDRLIDGIWGASPPASAANALQVHVHTLRAALGGDRIATRPPGYVLRVEPGSSMPTASESSSTMTIRMPRCRCGAGRRSPIMPTRSSLAPAPGCSRRAGSQPSKPASRRISTRDGMRPSPPSSRRSSPRTLTARPCARLQMRALYRSGRQAEALAAFHEARSALDELGLEPSAELRALQQQILRHEPSLAAPQVALAPSEEAPGARLIGRAIEVAAISALLGRGDTRLVTLTGPGGTGKTRLALAVAEALVGDAAVVVELGPVSEPHLVATSVAKALGVGEEPGRAVESTLVERVAELDRLLVLDNFEHLLGAAPLVGELVRAAPGLRVLVTSRAPLRLTTEHEYRVAPLRVPGSDVTSVEAVRDVDAVRVFVARAQAVLPSFELRDDNVVAVASICRALDGLPLAIELAAARIRVLGPEGMAQRIGQRLALLTRSAPDLPERQRSLRATIDWSVRLLDEQTQRVFAALGVFAAPASLESIEHVVGDAVPDVPAALEALLDSSLVLSDADAAGEPRFRMLETIREYAVEELRNRDVEGSTRRLHLDAVLSIVTRWDASRRDDPNDRGDMASVDAIYPDVVAALNHAAATSSVEQEFQLLGIVWRYWRWRGYVEDAHHHLDAASTSSDPRIPPLDAANALLGASVIELIRGDLERAGTHAERAAASYAAGGEPLLEAKALTQLASIANAMRRARPRALAVRASRPRASRRR